MSEKQWYVKYAADGKIWGPMTEQEAIFDCSWGDAADAIIFTMDMLTKNWQPALLRAFNIIELSLKYAQECVAKQKEAELKLEQMRELKDSISREKIGTSGLNISDSDLIQELRHLAAWRNEIWRVGSGRSEEILKILNQAADMIKSFSREKSSPTYYRDIE